MLLLFAPGVMNLIVIVALMLWVLAEKLLPYGEQTARASGVRAARPRCLDRYHLTPRYALRHTKGAYCALLRPLVSSQLRPNAARWLFEARARLNVSAAGCPVCASCNGGDPGLRPRAPLPSMQILFAAFTDHDAPSRSKTIGADSAPRNLPTS